jgi:hypothetical protein
MLRDAIRSLAWVASAAKARRQKTRKKRLRALFFRLRFLSLCFAVTGSREPRSQGRSEATRGKKSQRRPAIRHFLPSREGFNYNTGHFGAGNTVARRVIKPASPRNCRQETYS